MLKSLHHVRFKVNDVTKLKAFAQNFGLIEIEESSERLVMKTLGGDMGVYVAEKADHDAFVGFAFEVDSREDLDFAVNNLGATAVADLDLPCGGEYVSLTDPDGNIVSLIYGASRIPAGELDPELMLNTPTNKTRYGHKQIGREFGPAKLWRIGHLAIYVKDFAKSSEWYHKNLGLIGSDVYNVPGQPEEKIVGFFRMNRGEEYVDHHVVALMQDQRGGCHHISFEAQDYEAQFISHRYLETKEYESIWGVGRHPHGCHVFDVWRSPDGARFETYTDTDLMREDNGTDYHDISQIDMDNWSNEPPDKYFI
jgi:catechol 2,3-dioxygenase-like lactoylglutathione lyase family enzyme